MKNLNRANLIRGGVLLLVAAFFGYRYVQLDGVIYPVLIAIFTGIGLASLIHQLPVRWQNIALNTGVTFFFLDLVFAEINLGEVGHALALANYWMFIPSTGFVLIHLYFRSVRSQWLLKSMDEVGFWPAFRALVIGITGNVVLPARAGEFLRAYVLSRRTRLPATGVFATLVIERIFDGLTVVLILIVMIILGVRDPLLQQAGIVGGVVFVGAIIALAVFMTQRQLTDRIIRWGLPAQLADWVIGLCDGFTQGLTVLRHPRQLVMVTIYDLLTWAPIPFSFLFVLWAFDFGAAVPWQAPILILPAMALSLSVPATPGGVGVVHAAVSFTLSVLFVESEVAPNFEEVVAATSIMIHLSQFAPQVMLGAGSFMIEGLSRQDIAAGQSLTVAEKD